MPDETKLGDAEFQKKVLDATGAQATEIDGLKKSVNKVETILGDLTRADAPLKLAVEDLTKMKKWANDTQANFDATVRKIGDIEKLARRQALHDFGNPIKRIQQDEQMRTRFNIAIREAVNSPNNDMARVVAPLRKALGEDSSPGSTVIDDALATEIYDTLAMFGCWNTFGVRNLGTKQTKFPVKTVRPIANFILTEAGTISDDTNKAGTSVTLEVELIAALLNVSLQLIQDAEIDVTADVMNDFGEAYANRLDHACLQAAGAADATDGGMTGVFSGGTAAAAGAGNSTTETTDLEDWQRCLLTVDPIVMARSARWWMHPQHVVRAIAVRDLNGRPIFQTALESPNPRTFGTILGYPVTPCYAAPTANVATTKVAVFGDPEGLVVGLRTDYTFEASDHHRWNTYERSFRGTGRAGTKIRRALAFAMLTLTA